MVWIISATVPSIRYWRTAESQFQFSGAVQPRAYPRSRLGGHRAFIVRHINFEGSRAAAKNHVRAGGAKIRFLSGSREA